MKQASARSFDELTRRLQETDTYWIESAKADFAVGLSTLFDATGINQEEYAERLGKSPAWISKVFRGNVNFTIATMVGLVRTLGGRLHLQVACPGEDVAFVRKAPVDAVNVRPGLSAGSSEFSYASTLATLSLVSPSIHITVPANSSNDGTYRDSAAA